MRTILSGAAHEQLSACDLADRLNLKRYPRSWRGECPSCSYDSAFVVKARDGGGVALFCANGCLGRDLHDAVVRRIGGDCAPTRARRPDDSERRRLRQEAAGRLCSGAVSLRNTPGAAYLGLRGLSAFVDCPALGYRSDVSHPENRGQWAAMIASVVNADGGMIAAHRTYIGPDGHKADVTPAKASLGPIWGGVVRLGASLPDPRHPQLVIGEGVESAASAGLLMDLPAWAALSAGNLAKGLNLPGDIHNLVIAADHDRRTRDGHYPGQEAARAAAKRWRAEGRAVAIALPDRCGQDFNDLLKAGVPNG